MILVLFDKKFSIFPSSKEATWLFKYLGRIWIRRQRIFIHKKRAEYDIRINPRARGVLLCWHHFFSGPEQLRVTLHFNLTMVSRRRASQSVIHRPFPLVNATRLDMMDRRARIRRVAIPCALKDTFPPAELISEGDYARITSLSTCSLSSGRTCVSKFKTGAIFPPYNLFLYFSFSLFFSF